MNKETRVRRASGSVEAPVVEQLVAAADRAELRHKPFDHVYMEDVLEPRTYVADGPFTWLKYRLRRSLLSVGIHPER